MALAPNALFRSDMTMLEPPQNRLSPSQIWPMENPVGTEQVRPQYLTAPDADVVPGVMWGDRMTSPRVAGGLNSAMDVGMGFAGSTGPGGRLGLERINPRTLRPLAQDVDLGKPGAHAFQIKGPKGETLGVVDTEWNPETGGLHIADFQSNEGANSLGHGLVRQIRDQLLSLYPEAKSLTGQRITGAVSADRRSGAGPGRVATQVLGQE
jgi:hypothetical protein